MNIKEKIVDKRERGTISMVLEKCEIGSISRIECEPNTWRARHHHPNDSHWIIINEGQIEIYELPVDSKDCPTKTVLNKGDIHFTSPMVLHEMVFNCFTVFDCYSKLPRNTENYENETVRFDYSLKDIYDSFPYQNG